MENNSKHIYECLYQMKTEYASLNKEEKIKYMNLLTEWYMKQKDMLYAEANESKKI